MAARSALIEPPAGKLEYDAYLNAARVVRYLLTNRPNEVVTHADVCEALGYEVTPQAVCNAVGRLTRGSYGLPIITNRRAGGGHILLVPVLTLGRERCANCSSRTPLSVCRLISRPRYARIVNPNQWCRGWSQCQS